MLNATQAMQKAASTTRWAVGMCDNFVANMYGYTSSGYTTAVTHWQSIPASDKHPGNSAAPAGALMFWGGGMGHVAISDGSGGVYSTDQPGPGQVAHISADQITKGWGKPYLGWSVPYFQGQPGTTGQLQQAGSNAVQAASIVDPLGSLASSFGTDGKDLLERFGLIVMGTALIILALVHFTKTGNDVKNAVVSKATGGVA